MLELWRQLMTAPLLPAIRLPWSASNSVQLGQHYMLTLQQDVVHHMKVTGRAAVVPTAHWGCPLIGELHSPYSGAAMRGIL